MEPIGETKEKVRLQTCWVKHPILSFVFQGGANAGHTIINDYGKFALHTLPSGVFYNHTTSVIGNGVALNIPVLFKEIEGIAKSGGSSAKDLSIRSCADGNAISHFIRSV